METTRNLGAMRQRAARIAKVVDYLLTTGRDGDFDGRGLLSAFAWGREWHRIARELRKNGIDIYVR